MPLRSDIQKVVILGSGPIVIGQACEFDYSGTQACKALMSLGLEVVLINSNPATIMTDPEIATRVYIEPLKLPFIEKILEHESPDAIIPTLGGQTALNLALELDRAGVLNRLNIKMLAANPEVIQRAEDREKFSRILDSIGAKYPKSRLVKNFEDGVEFAETLGFPIILRPNYTLGGGGGGIAFSMEDFKNRLVRALHESPTQEVLVEESIYGWKEYELEVMRDRKGTFVVICSIENLDPCGVHTGDSITVAPQQTLSDHEYQAMRTEAKNLIEAIGVETGGANVQFAVDPKTGDRVVIEMNPRVSRSSALASKATGFPIAKIAALLSVGFTLDEIKNDITQTTPSCYEPALDYVVTKIPRFAFEKFQGSEDRLTTQMKSVGEVMAIGRNFKESLLKALMSMEKNPYGPKLVNFNLEKLSHPNSSRIFYVFQAFREGFSVEKVHELTSIDYWFLEQIYDWVQFEKQIGEQKSLTDQQLQKAKRWGFSDVALATLLNEGEKTVRKMRHEKGIRPRYYQVDTCAGEFASETPYFYSTYWGKPLEHKPMSVETVAVLGSGPNRIGQGIEFDYSCVRTVNQFQELGYNVAMINSNPETVSTDYDTSDELFFEPLTAEHVLEIFDYLKPEGFVAQVGGQTPILLAQSLVSEGFKLIGSDLEAIDKAEDRGRFIEVCRTIDFKIPESGMASSYEQALEFCNKIGYPVICRPSYVLGGSRMEIVENKDDLESYFRRYGSSISDSHPCLMDQFLDRALEVDVDLVRGEDWSIVGGVIEHIEAAGVHSGDSMGVIPPQRLKSKTLEKIEALSLELADKLNILGFLNLQLAIKNDEVYMIEANPRSSRSVPFIAKATGIPLVDLGTKAMAGVKKSEVKPELYDWKKMTSVCVKGVVFPFKKFQDADSILGPEMKSTGESMGRGRDYAEALLKALYSSQMELPSHGEVFLSWREKDKAELLSVAKDLLSLGFTFSATKGTAEFLKQNSIPVIEVKKVAEGRPNCVDRIRSGKVAFVINTTSGRQSIEASVGIRRSCVDYSIPCITESMAAQQVVKALVKNKEGQFTVSHL